MKKFIFTLLILASIVIYISSSRVQQKSSPSTQSTVQPLVSSIPAKQPENTNNSQNKSLQQLDNKKAAIKFVRHIYENHANDKIHYRFENSKDATPELQEIMRQFYQLDNKIRRQPYMEMGCDMYPHYYFGFGNGGAPDNLKRTLQLKVIKPQIIRATFKDSDGTHVGADVYVRCDKQEHCLIDDIKNINDRNSMKTDFSHAIKTQSCGPDIDPLQQTISPSPPNPTQSSITRYYDSDCLCSDYKICYGPRGGRYCITSGGNKRYNP